MCLWKNYINELLIKYPNIVKKNTKAYEIGCYSCNGNNRYCGLNTNNFFKNDGVYKK